MEAAKGFLTVVRSYLDSLCSNLRSHTITNVQSNNDKVSVFCPLQCHSIGDSYCLHLLHIIGSLAFSFLNRIL